MTLQDYKQWLGGFLEGKENSILTQEDRINIISQLDLVHDMYIHNYPQITPYTYPNPSIETPVYKPDITCNK